MPSASYHPTSVHELRVFFFVFVLEFVIMLSALLEYFPAVTLSALQESFLLDAEIQFTLLSVLMGNVSLDKTT